MDKSKNRTLDSSVYSKKYIRNPRQKGWMLCRRLDDGTFECLADETIMTVGWSKQYGRLWSEKESANYYLIRTKEWDSYHGEDTFIVRVNSKNCPIIVDFVKEAYRAKKGNVCFSKK